MNNPQISISYNGHKTAVTCMEDNIYMVQITSHPYLIQHIENGDGLGFWIEVESKRTTLLSTTIGDLIKGQQL